LQGFRYFEVFLALSSGRGSPYTSIQVSKDLRIGVTQNILEIRVTTQVTKNLSNTEYIRIRITVTYILDCFLFIVLG